MKQMMKTENIARNKAKVQKNPIYLEEDDEDDDEKRKKLEKEAREIRRNVRSLVLVGHIFLVTNQMSFRTSDNEGSN